MRFGAALILVAMIALLPACAKKTTTVNTPNGPVTVTQDNSVRQATVQTDQGKVTMGQGAVDPNNLGLPVYPGATPSEAGSYSMQTKQGSAQIVTIETHDPFDKVVAFYKDKMPAGTQSSQTATGAAAVAQFVNGKDTDKSHKQVMISQANGVVRITLIVGNNP
jgi:hypothetical protein